VAGVDSGAPDGRAWIEGLGPELAVQARLLRGLLAAAEADERWAWLELGCSVAAGRGDAWSDLDVALGYVGDDPPPVDEVSAMLRGLGDVIDLSAGPWDGASRWWVQYKDGGQIDLVMLPAAGRPGRAPGSVVLLDRAARLRETFTPRVWRAQPDEPRQWLMDGWEALGNVAKYVHRDSLLEAIEQVHRARGRVLQLWAAGEDVEYPSFGLASLLDAPDAGLPEGIEATYPVADRESVLEVALALAAMLHLAGEHAEPGTDTPLRGYVTALLRDADRTGEDPVR
jgi:hypothetical protein